MERVPVGSVADFPPGRGTRVDVGEHRVAIFAVGDELYAIGDRCSHAEASLAEGELFDFDVECPRHGSEFDVRTGEPNTLPATVAVPTYVVEREGDDVYLLLRGEAT